MTQKKINPYHENLLAKQLVRHKPTPITFSNKISTVFALLTLLTGFLLAEFLLIKGILGAFKISNTFGIAVFGASLLVNFLFATMLFNED